MSTASGPPPRAANPALPPEIDGVLRRGLARNAEQRFESCGALVNALAHALEKGPASHPTIQRMAPPTRTAPVKRLRKALLPAVSLAVVLTAVACAFFLYKQEALRSFLFRSDQAPTPAAPPPKPMVKTEPVQQIIVPKAAPPMETPPARPKHKTFSAAERARESYEAATEKRREGQMEEAIALLGQAAALGNVDAMTELGEGYRDGDGVPQNQIEAVRWFRRAADAGSSSGMVFLGAMYFLEDVPGGSDELAARWFQRAADRGNQAGMYNLATMYESGRGVAKNSGTALELYRKAAALGNIEAQRRLTELQSQK